MVYPTRRFVLPYVLLFLYFSPFSIANTSLGEERANLSAFRTFVRFALVWFCLFPLPLRVCDGLRLVIVTLPGHFSYLFLFFFFFFFFYRINDLPMCGIAHHDSASSSPFVQSIYRRRTSYLFQDSFGEFIYIFLCWATEQIKYLYGATGLREITKSYKRIKTLRNVLLVLQDWTFGTVPPFLFVLFLRTLDYLSINL